MKVDCKRVSVFPVIFAGRQEAPILMPLPWFTLSELHLLQTESLVVYEGQIVLIKYNPLFFSETLKEMLGNIYFIADY